MRTSNRFFSLTVLGLGCGGLLATAVGCGEDNPILKQCGFTCSETAYVDGQASISGIVEVDAFFSASLELESTMNQLSGDIRAELDAIALSLDLQKGAGGAEIAAAVNAQFSAAGSVSIEFQPPRCEVSIEASASAAAECDVEVDPGMATVSCQGSCEVEAGVEVDCGAEAELKCTGTAPNLQCDGGCTGTCSADLSAGGSCEGTCNGTCSGTCSLTNADGECEGSCDGMCQGTCEVELKAEATCEGSCEGQCTYDAPEGGCEASASASCEAMAGGSVECSGSCEGDFEPPSVSAECEATVEAKASAKAECFPPELAIVIEFDASFDASAQAEFKAWLEGFKGHFSALLALRARGELIGEASLNLLDAGEGAVDALLGELSGSTDLKAQFGGVCAVANLPDALSGVGQASASLSGEVEATASFFADVNI